jgi:hypothetical protein
MLCCAVQAGVSTPTMGGLQPWPPTLDPSIDDAQAGDYLLSLTATAGGCVVELRAARELTAVVPAGAADWGAWVALGALAAGGLIA